MDNDNATATIGRNVKDRRDELGMSQVELADRLRIRQPSINKIEKSKGYPSSRTVLNLCIALECAADRLLKDVDARYSKIVAGQENVRSHTFGHTATPQDGGGQHERSERSESGKVIDLRIGIKRQLADAQKRSRELLRVIEHIADDGDKPGVLEPLAVAGPAPSTRRKGTRGNRR